MVIYFSCKYYKTIYSAPLDVKASQDSRPPHTALCSMGLMRILSLPHLCAHYQIKRALVAKSGVLAPTSVSSP